MRPEQAEVALEQLEWIDDDTATRIHRARQYYEGLEGLPQIRRAPFTDDGSHIYTYYPIQVCDRQALLQFAVEHKCDFAAQHLRNCADLPDFRDVFREEPARVLILSDSVLPTLIDLDEPGHFAQQLIESVSVPKRASKHDPIDAPRVPNIVERVCVQQDEIGPLSRSNDARLFRWEQRRRIHRCGPQSLRWGEA